MSLNKLAEDYVKLTLAVGQHHEYYIDAYYGPEEWKPTDKKSLSELRDQTSTLLRELDAITPPAGEEKRYQLLYIQTRSILTFIKLIKKENVKFNEESLELYDAISPEITKAQLDEALVQLDGILPGEGDINTRMVAYSSQFIIPTDKLDSVFKAAVDESRERTKRYIELDDNENFTIEYVTDKVWSGYNWYKGNNYSLIQMNTDFPISIDRAIDLASHEGYPGHHVFNSLMEKHLVNAKGWMEYCVYPLYSPMSLLAEGSANYGIEVVFPKQERLQFEKDVLFPLAGLDASRVEEYYRIQDLKMALSYADNMVAQRYLDGEIDKEKAIALLMKYTLVTREKATQRLGFIEANRAYVINYNLGQDLTKAYVEKKAGSQAQDKIWQVFTDLLANPITASMMK